MAPTLPKTTRSRLKAAARWLVALIFVWIGAQHFLNPAPFISIMPPYLPWHLELVYISGFFEIVGGLGVLLPATRHAAGWGLIALLIAVYPANIHMLTHEVYLEGMPRSKLLLWLRMPMQFIFAAWVLWSAELWPRTHATHHAAGDDAAARDDEDHGGAPHAL